MGKANAYGHGGGAVARRLYQAGCRSFGVVSIAAARSLAGLPAAAAVVVFGGIMASEAVEAVACGAEVVTQEADVIAALAGAARANGRQALVHIKVDTGMHRLGLRPENAAGLARLVADTEGVGLAALCSHFAKAESVTAPTTEGQLETLLEASRAVRTAGVEHRLHLANSAAVMTRPETHLDMVRPGLMLYGLLPAPGLAGRAELRPVMTLAATVVRVADVGAGEGISYGHSYRTERPSRIATVRCGYADGYPRVLSNAGRVSVEGRSAPVVGRVCMDHLMIDVTGIDDVAVGSEAVLWGQDPGAAELAEAGATIPYELVARVGARVEREYL